MVHERRSLGARVQDFRGGEIRRPTTAHLPRGCPSILTWAEEWPLALAPSSPPLGLARGRSERPGAPPSGDRGELGMVHRGPRTEDQGLCPYSSRCWRVDREGTRP